MCDAKLKPFFSIRNRHNERPVDLLPPPRADADKESDDEKVRSAIRRAEAEASLADRGDVVDGESANSWANAVKVKAMTDASQKMTTSWIQMMSLPIVTRLYRGHRRGGEVVSCRMNIFTIFTSVTAEWQTISGRPRRFLMRPRAPRSILVRTQAIWSSPTQ